MDQVSTYNNMVYCCLYLCGTIIWYTSKKQFFPGRKRYSCKGPYMFSEKEAQDASQTVQLCGDKEWITRWWNCVVKSCLHPQRRTETTVDGWAQILVCFLRGPPHESSPCQRPTSTGSEYHRDTGRQESKLRTPEEHTAQAHPTQPHYCWSCWCGAGGMHLQQPYLFWAAKSNWVSLSTGDHTSITSSVTVTEKPTQV